MLQLNYSSNKFAISKSNILVLTLFLTQIFINCMFFKHILFVILNFTIILIIASFNQILKEMVIYIKSGLFIGIFVIIFNILLNPNGQTILYISSIKLPLYGFLTITLETIINSIVSTLSLISLMMVFGLLNRLVNPDKLTKVFAKLGLPYAINFMIMTSIRFFPLLIADLQRITDVQKSRGFELEGKNVLVKIKNQLILILPLLTNSLDRSIQMAEALEARGFGLDRKRTTHKPIKFKKISYITLILIITLFVISIITFFSGMSTFDPYPLFSGFDLGLEQILFFSAELILMIFIYGLLHLEGRH